MSKLKRLPLKYIRDRAKSAYEKGTECRICRTTENLEFHHHYTLTPLMNKWLSKTGFDVEDVLEWRDTFIEEHHEELYVHASTLCKTHHAKLHSIYGKTPSLGTASKQMRWVERMREKHSVNS